MAALRRRKWVDGTCQEQYHLFFFQFSLFFNVFLGFLHIIIDLPSESPSEPSFDVRWLGIPTAEGEGLRPAALGALLEF